MGCDVIGCRDLNVTEVPRFQRKNNYRTQGAPRVPGDEWEYPFPGRLSPKETCVRRSSSLVSFPMDDDHVVGVCHENLNSLRRVKRKVTRFIVHWCRSEFTHFFSTGGASVFFSDPYTLVSFLVVSALTRVGTLV